VSGEMAEEIIVYVALGIAAEYATILPEVYWRAQKAELGQKLPVAM
jgi:ornithine cyclodeaminase/alanine dehydrogenase-like protein (mu-crystallin family)